MSTAVLTAPGRSRTPARLTPRLVAAEILKLRRRRGLLSLVAVFTVGASVLTYGILAILHAANAAHHGPAGGLANFGHGMFVLSMLGAIAAAIVGATTGAGDLGAGVFRELVVTGRSRGALFRARIPGGLAFLLSFEAAAFALAAVASVVLAGGLAAPSTTLLAGAGAWLMLQTAFYFLLALGLASLVGSRTTSITVLLAWRLALTPALIAIGFLGVAREAVPGAALLRLAPSALRESLRQGANLGTSLPAAVLVIVAWLVVALALGAWRTASRDA